MASREELIEKAMVAKQLTREEAARMRTMDLQRLATPRPMSQVSRVSLQSPLKEATVPVDAVQPSYKTILDMSDKKIESLRGEIEKKSAFGKKCPETHEKAALDESISEDIARLATIAKQILAVQSDIEQNMHRKSDVLTLVSTGDGIPTNAHTSKLMGEVNDMRDAIAVSEKLMKRCMVK